MSRLTELIDGDQIPLLLLFIFAAMALVMATFNHDLRDIAVAASGAFAGAAGMRARGKAETH